MAKSDKAFPERDHGRPDCGEPVGPPKVSPAPPGAGPCPNCKCDTVFLIEVEVKVSEPMNRLLAGEKSKTGIAVYMGCPACPWASPAMVRRT